MSTLTMRIPTEVKNKLKTKAKSHHRSMSGEVAYYIEAGMLAEENPDLPFEFIRQTLEAKEEIRSGTRHKYSWGITR